MPVLNAPLPKPRTPDRARFVEVPPAGQPRNTGFACARPGCGTAVSHRWWRRPGVMMDGEPLCSPRCLETRLRPLMARGNDSVKSEHRHRIPLGLLMLAQGWITPEQLQSALHAQQVSRAEGAEGRIGFFLDKQGSVTEDQITRALGLQWHCPVFDLRNGRPYAPGWAPRALANAYEFVPLRVSSSGELFIAFNGALDASVILAMQRMWQMPVVGGLLAESQYMRARTAFLEDSADRTEMWNASGKDDICRAASQWVFRAASGESPQSVQGFHAVTLHKHFWLRSAANNNLLIAIG